MTKIPGARLPWQLASRTRARVMAERENPRWLKHDARGERRRDRRPIDGREG